MEHTFLVDLERFDDVATPRIEVFYATSRVAVVALSGEYDFAMSERALRTLLEVVGSFEPDDILVVDLSSATFVDSSIVGSLIAAERRATEAGVTFKLEPRGEPIAQKALRLADELATSYAPQLY